MSFEVEISAQAESDLRDVFDYIAVKLKAVRTAAGQLSRLQNEIQSLSDMPERYHLYEREPWHSRGLRVLTVDNYCVFYAVHNESNAVFVVRVMYGGRNIDAELSKIDAATLEDVEIKLNEAELEVHDGKLLDATDSLDKIRHKYGFTDEIELKLNEADKAAAADSVRYTEPEMFGGVRKHLRG